MKRLWVLLIALALLSGCAAAPTFNGSRVMNDDRFEMKYDAFNGTIAHVLALRSGDVLDVEISDRAGSVDAVVRLEGGAPIYRGADIPNSRFQLLISEDGRYEIAVSGNGARGSVRFQRADASPNAQTTKPN